MTNNEAIAYYRDKINEDISYIKAADPANFRAGYTMEQYYQAQSIDIIAAKMAIAALEATDAAD